jgi:phenylalanyl-tRNA synthetase alpha chain
MPTAINVRPIPADQLAALLGLRDLADPTAGPHAIQLIVDRIEAALSARWGVPIRRDAGPRIVSVTDNYDRLRYNPEDVTRDSRYSRYLGDGRMLRSHTSARIPALLDALDTDTVLSVPGVCYRRDVIDRQHVGEPHQMDVWRIQLGGPPLADDDLTEMIGTVVGAALPGVQWYTVPAVHPYTLNGREIYARVGGHDVEIGECGLAHPEVLRRPGWSGLAMGLGLDRLVMLAKGVDDIRLLRSTDRRVAAQMLDLTPYRPVSAQPATVRDLSLAVAADVDAELLGDRVRALLGPAAATIEEITVCAQTAWGELPDTARARMGLVQGQKNVLLRLVIRDLDRTLTAAQANEIRDRIYAGLHEGTAGEWTSTEEGPRRIN